MKKSLLNESEIRKFMKFANITPLTENFLDRVQEETVAEEETVTEETVAEVTDPLVLELDVKLRAPLRRACWTAS